MSSLTYPDLHHAIAAKGWLELGALSEADHELDQISPEHQDDPVVLDLRWQVLAERKSWDAALEWARRHIQMTPDSPVPWIHQSFALHELGRTQEAFDALQPRFEQFSEVGTIPYNLACYCCRLGRLNDARKWLRRAVDVQGRTAIIEMAQDDPDLLQIRPELAGLL